jgi:hypothetical protein
MPRPVLCRLRPSARRPYQRLGLDAGYIAQSERGDVGTQIRVCAIAGIHQDHSARQASRACPAQLLKCDRRLGFEGDLLGHTGFAPTRTVRRPLLWQIEAIGYRQARIMIGNRECHGKLTIVLLAKLAVICISWNSIWQTMPG